MFRRLVVALVLLVIVFGVAIPVCNAEEPVRFAFDSPPWWAEQAVRFNEETGIALEYESVPWPELHNFSQVGLLSGVPGFDILHAHDLWIAEWAPKGLLLPLDDFIDPDLAADYPRLSR